MAAIRDIENSIPMSHGINQATRTPDRDKVFVQMHRHEIALIRGAMVVALAFK